MDFPSRIPSKLTPAVDFDPEEFRKMVMTHGLRVWWEQSAECPCSTRSKEYLRDGSRFTQDIDAAGQSVYTGEPRANCPACKGNGYVLHSGQQIRAVLTGAKHNPKAFEIYGEYANGMISVSTLPEHLPGYQDRFTLLDSAMVYRETRIAAGSVDKLRYPIVSRLLDLVGGPTPFAGVLYCLKAGVTGEVPVGFAPLEDGVDFEVTAEGYLDWALGLARGTAPTPGEPYSVTYCGAPRFAVVDYPHSLRDTWVKIKTANRTYQALPINAMARLEFMGMFNK